MSTNPSERSLRDLESGLVDDPWSLTHAERRRIAEAQAKAQETWHRRLSELIEAPRLDPEFPAFLLATEPFAPLATAIGTAGSARDLDTATADTLEHFVERYRRYLVWSEEQVSAEDDWAARDLIGR